MADRELMEKLAAHLREEVKNPDQLNPAGISEWVAESPVLYTPRFWKPITDRNWMIGILTMVPRAIEGFTYFRHWIDGNELIMEFKGNVGQYGLQGIDIFSLNDEGKIQELTVFVRPPNSLAALGEVEDRMLKEMFGVATQKEFSSANSA